MGTYQDCLQVLRPMPHWHGSGHSEKTSTVLVGEGSNRFVRHIAFEVVKARPLRSPGDQTYVIRYDKTARRGGDLGFQQPHN